MGVAHSRPSHSVWERVQACFCPSGYALYHTPTYCQCKWSLRGWCLWKCQDAADREIEICTSARSLRWVDSHSRVLSSFIELFFMCWFRPVIHSSESRINFCFFLSDLSFITCHPTPCLCGPSSWFLCIQQVLYRVNLLLFSPTLRTSHLMQGLPTFTDINYTQMHTEIGDPLNIIRYLAFLLRCHKTTREGLGTGCNF